MDKHLKDTLDSYENCGFLQQGPMYRKVGPNVLPKPNKAEPQVPVIPKSHTIKKFSEPSFSTVLNRYGHQAGNDTSVSHSTYANFPPPPPPPQVEPLYSNLQNRRFKSRDPSEDDLPPPPLDSSLEPELNHLPPPLPEDLPPPSPPSPVSSSYSELRRATGNEVLSPYGGPYATYAPLSQISIEESVYEPIQPRPASQMSTSSKSGTNYTLYGPYGPKGLAPAPSSQPSASGDRYGQEDEVDALTSLLVKSMDAASDPDFFGMCAGCGSKVVGEGTGCTAMGQVYHIRCFTCVVCCALLQGKPFYAVEGKPYCEEDYLNTLEKCCVCTAPILDRILRATGKPYHPQCFRCIMCGLCLDGIPFTVDAANQIHCIDDFHKKFAPRCSVCHLPIMPEPGQEETVRVVAMDRSFHVHCYKCEDCGTILSSEAEGRGCYPLDEHVLCKTCNARRVQALTSCVSTEL